MKKKITAMIKIIYLQLQCKCYEKRLCKMMKKENIDILVDRETGKIIAAR